MSQAIQYSKYYWYLTEEDKGFGISETPKGHIRCETKDKTCQIILSVQNLKPCNPGFCYKFYLISMHNDSFKVAYLGDIGLKNNRGILSCSFPIDNVSNTHLDANAFNIAVIAYQSDNLTAGTDISYPLSGYKNEKTLWKSKLHSYLLPQKTKQILNDKPASKTYVEKKGNPQTNNNITTNIKNLENLLSMSFTECKPFRRTNSITRYWRINNHQLLNRILDSCSSPELMLINNYLNMAYYIYGYYIVSVENINNSYHFSYGIPSLYGIDPKPSNLHCKWQSENYNEELYGEFGYWMVRFDMLTGRIVEG